MFCVSWGVIPGWGSAGERWCSGRTSTGGTRTSRRPGQKGKGGLWRGGSLLMRTTWLEAGGMLKCSSHVVHALRAAMAQKTLSGRRLQRFGIRLTTRVLPVNGPMTRHLERFPARALAGAATRNFVDAPGNGRERGASWPLPFLASLLSSCSRLPSELATPRLQVRSK